MVERDVEDAKEMERERDSNYPIHLYCSRGKLGHGSWIYHLGPANIVGYAKAKPSEGTI